MGRKHHHSGGWGGGHHRWFLGPTRQKKVRDEVGAQKGWELWHTVKSRTLLKMDVRTKYIVPVTDVKEDDKKANY